MPRTRECDFCGDDIEPGTGTMFVQNDGSTVMFCSSKCEKNADLGREARDMGWTEAGRAAGGKRAAETADEPDEPETEEQVEAEPEDPAATEGDVVEDTGAAPNLEDAESEATPGPEDEGADEAAADADADSAAAVDDADEAEADDEADEDDAEEEEAEA
ncbi:50S ribosomal protein L24e [Halorientalis regularis]|jgi:large subunit ribosomal protein L24e|uniref:Large ribosomal subunit protein eL24 n=1 Tax=Halorientalis regularis TaxID=660518 RepID=A0A1G7MZZ6_9EURY|nr:50S ribosomal protein L24e [Halorientalis regularis]SDF67282.1 LSU ribosomal protein L24E [Halorientalis regularis]